jgi:hypothetical protein
MSGKLFAQRMGTPVDDLTDKEVQIMPTDPQKKPRERPRKA